MVQTAYVGILWLLERVIDSPHAIPSGMHSPLPPHPLEDGKFCSSVVPPHPSSCQTRPTQDVTDIRRKDNGRLTFSSNGRKIWVRRIVSTQLKTISCCRICILWAQNVFNMSWLRPIAERTPNVMNKYIQGHPPAYLPMPGRKKTGCLYFRVFAPAVSTELASLYKPPCV